MNPGNAREPRRSSFVMSVAVGGVAAAAVWAGARVLLPDPAGRFVGFVAMWSVLYPTWRRAVPASRPAWVYWSLGALVLGVGGLIWWFH